MFKQFDIRMRPHPGLQGRLDRLAGGVGGMHDAPMAVPAFPMQVEPALLVGGFIQAGKINALADQPVDAGAGLLHHSPDHGRVAQSGPGRQRVGDMGVDGILLVGHGGDAALGIERGALAQRFLGEHGNPRMIGQLQRKAQPGRAAADDQDLMFCLVLHLAWVSIGSSDCILPRINRSIARPQITADGRKSNR